MSKPRSRRGVRRAISELEKKNERLEDLLQKLLRAVDRAIDDESGACGFSLISPGVWRYVKGVRNRTRRELNEMLEDQA